ncbi:HDAC-interact domain-containing protein [Aphelenchoides bicaudatus]|nr:HDAC-interact domain-containing protein [Aphelenchoides bicaudatus]
MNSNNSTTNSNHSSNFQSNASTGLARTGYAQQSIPQTLRVNNLHQNMEQFNNGHIDANSSRDYVEEVYADEAPSRSQQSAPQRNQPLQVEDALCYLEQVRQQFTDTPEIYSTFLEVMKDFKSQIIDTQGVIRKVGDLFVDHPRLIIGFNTFLPTGYEVQVINGTTLKIIEPNGIIEFPLNPDADNDASENELDDAVSMTPDEPLGFDEPLKIDFFNDFQTNENQTLDDALVILNKIKERYNNQPQIYQQFLTLLGNYQASMRSGDPDDRPDLHNRLLNLFKDDADLLADLRTFMPVIFSAANEASGKGAKFKRKNMDALLKKRKRSLIAKQIQESSLTEKQMQFFEKINALKAVFKGPNSINSFYHAMNLYNQRTIGRSDMINLLTPFFVHSPSLMRTLNEIFNEAEEPSRSERLPLEMRVAERKAMEVDYVSVRRLGQSYREQAQEKRDAICSGRKIKHKMVLNDDWVAYASWLSEDSPGVTAKKTPFEETMWRIEDERFDYDICESILESSCGVLSQTQAKINAIDARDRRKFKLDDTYNCPNQPTLIPRCVKRVYGEHASKILSALRNSPEESVTCVLKRFEVTLEEMKKEKIAHKERWAEQTRACLSRSLDAQATLYRTTDSKFLRCRSIIQDIERIYEERTKLTESMNIDGMLPPLITITYPKEMSVFFDAHYLIECTMITQNLTNEEMFNARFLLKFVLPTFLCINPANISAQDEISSVVNIDDYEKHPISYATKLNLNGFDEYIRNFYPEFANSGRKWERLFDKCTYFGTQNWVLFIRAHSVLCHRLNNIKEICRRKRADYEQERLAEIQNEENLRKTGFAGDSLASKSLESSVINKAATDPRNPSKFYNDMLDSIKMLLDANIDQTAYEDVMRTMFGTDAFPLYTMDKLLTVLTKYLIAILQDPTTLITLNLFKAYVNRKLLLAPEKQKDEENVYEFMSASVLNDTTCIKSTSLVVDNSLTVLFEIVDAPAISSWYDSYSKNTLDKESKPTSTENKITLTFLDSARAIMPRKRTTAFLRRNIRKTFKRLRTYSVLGDALIEQQAEESRESTPHEEDESDGEKNEESEKSPDVDMINVELAQPNLPQIESLSPKIPDPVDRKSTTFLVCDNINSIILNSSFGMISTYSGQFGLLLRRGSPYIAQKKIGRQVDKTKTSLNKLLNSRSANAGDFDAFTNGCIAVKFSHPVDESLTYNRYLYELKQSCPSVDKLTPSAIDEYVKKNCV